MRTTLMQGLRSLKSRLGTVKLSSEQTLSRIALAVIVALAAGLRFANLDAIGYANHYYTAAVASMLQSWHNFFFVAAEPGGAVSVDKPPVGFWLQTISAYFFGVNGFAVVLPQIIAGILSVILLYHLVRRSFGTVAGLVAALALAITPIVVATDRNNTIDSTLILALLLAAWAFIKATENGKLRYLLVGAVMVGIGFNIKMLEAYLALPAFLALYFLGASEKLWKKMAKLVATAAVVAIVSLSWAIAVDLTPADQRPYVGSSGNNSVISLALGYNGTQRLLGMGGSSNNLISAIFDNGSSNDAQGDGGQPGQSNQPGGQENQGERQAPSAGFAPPSGNNPPNQSGNGDASGQDGNFQPGAQDSNGRSTAPNGDGQGNGAPMGQGGQGGGGGGFAGSGTKGVQRLFTTPLSKEASWLLPLAVLGGLVLIFSSRPRWPLAPKHQAFILWGGWLLTAGVFFSVAGFFHEYYLSILGPPIAALVGIGVVEAWRMRTRFVWLPAILLAIGIGSTLYLQWNTAKAYFNSNVWWQPIVVGLAVIGFVALIVATWRKWRRIAFAACTVMILAVMVTPGIWSGLTVFSASGNQSLPVAYGGGGMGRANMGDIQVNQTLLNYLEANTQGVEYLVAVSSSQNGSDYVLATGRPVLYMGGFGGQDKVVTADDLTKLVAEGKLKYILWDGSGRGGPGGGQSDISSWITTHCVAVDGVGTGLYGASGSGMGGQTTLYECNTGQS